MKLKHCIDGKSAIKQRDSINIDSKLCNSQIGTKCTQMEWKEKNTYRLQAPEDLELVPDSFSTAISDIGTTIYWDLWHRVTFVIISGKVERGSRYLHTNKVGTYVTPKHIADSQRSLKVLSIHKNYNDSIICIKTIRIMHNWKQ